MNDFCANRCKDRGTEGCELPGLAETLGITFGEMASTVGAVVTRSLTLETINTMPVHIELRKPSVLQCVALHQLQANQGNVA